MRHIPYAVLLTASLTASLAACNTSESGQAGATNPRPIPSSVPPSTPGGAPGLDPAIFPQPGETAFLTANENEQLSLGTGNAVGANGRGELSPEADGDFAEGGAAGGAADPAAPPAQEPEAVPDPSREIVEADVYKLEGDLLYVLNRWRGLVILNVSDPTDLRVVGRLPFQAMPVEMYVRDGRAYIVMSDYFEYWQYDPEADPHGFHGSQVLIADVSVPARPVALGSLPVEGEVTDTRMVGDVLYTVSHRRADYWRYNTADWEDRTWIVSLNVADPQEIREIDRVTFQGQSTLIHVAQHAIFVAAWDPNFYLTDPLHEQETLVTYVDISDAGGDLRERGKVYVPGQIADKFKMDWFDGHFRVLAQAWRSDENITLHVVDTDHPDDLAIDASLPLDGVTNSGLLASRFEGERAFAATARWGQNQQIDELHTLDLSDAAQPVQADTMRIDQQISHFEVHGDRLLALGQYIPRNWNGDYKVALGLYDISNPASTSLIDLEKLGLGDSSSGANNDYKALKVFRDQSLILVPLSYWVQGANRAFDGVQLVDWRGDDLDERGRVASRGGVRRAFPVGEGDAEHLIAVGDQSIISIDATDRDHPTVDDTRDLIHQVHDVFDVQGLQIQITGDIYSGQIRAEVRPFGGEDDAPEITHVDLPFMGPPNVFREGDMLHLLGYAQKPDGSGGQLIRNLDLTNPRAPRLRGELWITDDFQYVYNQGQSFYARYWSPDAGLPINGNILPLTYRHVVEGAGGRRDFDSALRFIDLRDPDAPRIADGSVPMNDYPFVNKITHGNILVSTHVEQATTEAGENLLYHVRSYADRIDVSDPDHPVALPSVNVPGYVVDVNDDASLLFTVDFQWDDFGRRRNSLNVLKFTADDAAELVTVVPVADQIDRAAFRPDGDGLRVWSAAHKYPWWGVRGDTVASRQPYTVLSRLDFDAEGGLAAQSNASLLGYHFDLLDIEGRHAWLASNGPYGLLSLDVTDAARPAIEASARTLGYLSRIVVNDGDVYTPMGWFGVQRY
jgi:hypothetical protein